MMSEAIQMHCFDFRKGPAQDPLALRKLTSSQTDMSFASMTATTTFTLSSSILRTLVIVK